MKKRAYIFSVSALALFIITFIIGSMVDESLSEAIFSRNNTFGITCSAIGTIPGYGILGILAGGFISVGIKKDKHIAIRIASFICAALCVGLNIFFSGREFFGENGFYELHDKLYWLGFVIVTPISGGLALLGYKIGKDSDNPNLFWILCIVAFLIFMALIPGVTLLKHFFHRPRYRSVTAYPDITFHNWWQRCTNYETLMTQYGVLKEEFKSFPSGHAGACSVVMLFATFLPLINKKYQKWQLPLFIGGLAWTLLIAFTRILVGAHFLSDVSMGAMLTMLVTVVGYLITTKLKWFKGYLQEE